MLTLPDIIGYIGVIILLGTYAALQLDNIDPKGFWYSFNNMIVAILITVSLVYKMNPASQVIEVFWFFISAIGLWKWYSKKHD